MKVTDADIYPRAKSLVKSNLWISVMSMLDMAGLQTESGGCDSGYRDNTGSHKALAKHAVLSDIAGVSKAERNNGSLIRFEIGVKKATQAPGRKFIEMKHLT